MTAALNHCLTLLDRDLSWLEFNQRVLHEAEDHRTPLLERLKFLAIFSSNLDEFFMKRIGVLANDLHELPSSTTLDRGAHLKQRALRETIEALIARQAKVYLDVIRPELARSGIHLLEWEDLTAAEKHDANEFFRRDIYAVLTPLVVDPAHPFPFLSNLSLSLGVLLKVSATGLTLFGRVKVPGHVPYWVRLEARSTGVNDGEPTCRFVRAIDIIRANLGDLFPDMEVVEVMPFRVTRNADVEDDALHEDLVEQIEEELRQRRLEKVVRLEYAPPRSAQQVELLKERLGLDELFVYELTAEIDFTSLFAIAGMPRPELRDPSWEPVVPVSVADCDRTIFSAIRAGDILIHNPYENFDATVARFIRSACDDPKVLAVKMTVYRIGSDTALLDSLIRAAESGKQVVCLVEVTARFDERQNLHWGRELEKVGAHVVFGVLGLKTHTKTTLVVRSESDGIRCYAHVGTGNYDVKTAKLYTDLSLLTCDPILTADVVELFHGLTGGSLHRAYHKLLVAPVNMRQRFLGLIEREIANCVAGRPARIVAKLNQLEDREMCEALVRASQAGVSIDLIIRGFCVLPPGVPGFTDHIRVISVIGRFLEHSRIYYFQNGQDDPHDGDYFIGSADWMERNLSRRVEAIAPIEAPPLRQRLWQILQTMLADCRQAWDMHSDGTYTQRIPPADAPSDGPETVGTQATLMATAFRAPVLPQPAS
jgi:polyphosphate kinase